MEICYWETQSGLGYAEKLPWGTDVEREMWRICKGSVRMGVLHQRALHEEGWGCGEHGAAVLTRLRDVPQGWGRESVAV